MRRMLALFVVAGAVLASGAPPNPGFRTNPKISEVQRAFRTPDKRFSPFIFWFWDEPLNAEKMAEMARTMMSQGFSPGYAHARHPMVDTPPLPTEQWLRAPWFKAFDAVLKETEAKGYPFGYCDEYWWPSFQAAGRVVKEHPELRAVSLKWTVQDVPGGSEVKVPASFFAVVARLDQAPRTVAPEDEPALGQWIWHERGDVAGQKCWFRKTFDASAGASICLRITADDSYEAFLDGEPIGSGGNWSVVDRHVAAVRLGAGRHVLAVAARNGEGASGLIAGIAVRAGNQGEPLLVQTDGFWRCRLEQPGEGWAKPGFDDSGWSAARVIGGPDAPTWNLASKLAGRYQGATIQSKTLQVIGEGAAFTWKAPEGGAWRVYAFDRYYHPGVDGGEVNCLDENLAPEFIKIALEPYAQRYGEKLGRSIVGDFVDHEGAFGWRLAWSDDLARLYQERYGRDIRLWMPLMADSDREGQCSKARWAWYDLVSDLYAGQFEKVRDWHEKRGMTTTAHVWEESLPAQAAAVGDHMKLQRAITMPGQDCLVRKALSVHDFKETASVAEFEGRRSTTELMGAGTWEVYTPEFLKQSINSVTAWGICHVIPHAVFATRKLTGNPWTPDFYNESPFFPWMHLWTDFVRRTSAINSMGHAVPDVLVYNPLESVWANVDGRLLNDNSDAPNLMWTAPEDWEACRRMNAIDRSYSKALSDLTAGRVEFLVGDRHYLGKMTVRGGRLLTGPFAFRTLVLPPLDILSRDAAAKIAAFARSGGSVYALGSLPLASVEAGANDPQLTASIDALRGQPTFHECLAEPEGMSSRWEYGPGWVLPAEAERYGLAPLIASGEPGLESPVRFLDGRFAMLQHRRRIDGRDFFWLASNDAESHRCTVLLPGMTGRATIWDAETGKQRSVNAAASGEGLHVALQFEPYEGFWLVVDPQAKPVRVAQPAEPTVIATIEGPWRVSYDPKGQPPLENPMTPPAEFAKGVDKPLGDWREWGMPRFSGRLVYSKTFHLGSVGKRVYLDMGTVKSAAELWVNGKRIGMRFWPPHRFDVTGALRSGTNTVRIRVANLINNSYGDTKPSGLLGPVRVLSDR